MKKTEKLFEAFTELDDDLIENAIPKEQDYDVVKPALKIHSWKPWVAGAAVAAAAVGVVFAGMKLFGSNGKPGFVPALGDSSTLTGIYSDVSFDGPSFARMLADYKVYSSAEELVDAAQIICAGKVTDISFALLDNMTMRERSDDFYEMCSLFTIYEVEVTNGYKNFTGDNKLQFAVRGGMEGYKVEEQLALSEKLGDNAIIVMDHHPEIEIGEEYLFILHWADNGTPTIINNTQTAFPLSDSSYRDEFCHASANDIINCVNNNHHSNHHCEATITHDNQVISLENIDQNALAAAVQDAMVTDCQPGYQLNQAITDQDIEEYGRTGYAIDLIFNDIDAPLAGGGEDKKAQTICHAIVLIGGEYFTESFITYSYTSMGLDGSTEQQDGGMYFLSEKNLDALLAVIEASEQNHNDGVCDPVMLFDYFDNPGNMPVQYAKDFTLPEFPGSHFSWIPHHVMAMGDDDKWELYTGMPVYGVYLADLNGDGKREICSTVSNGSGMIDNRIYAYDYANGTLYELQNRSTSDYSLKLQDGVLMYVQQPQNGSSVVTKPLTLGAMTCHSTGGVHHEEESSHHDEPDTTAHHEEETSHHDEPEHTTVSPTPTTTTPTVTTGTHHSEHDETHH